MKGYYVKVRSHMCSSSHLHDKAKGQMGNSSCCRRNTLPPAPPPRRNTSPFHHAARQHLRQKFSASWKTCGQLRREAAMAPATDTAMERWARTTEHRLHNFQHHENSQLLQEVKALHRYEGVPYNHQG